MLKKAGIVVAAAAAGVLALTPFAFADNDSHHEMPAPGHVEYTNVEEGNLTNDCAFAQEGPTVDQDVRAGSSLVDVAGLATGAVAPVTTQIQALNCTNVGLTDVIDSDSNNETTAVEETEIEDSFNTED